MAKTGRILITGSSRRLGLALSHHYLDLGWEVISHYRTHRDSIDELRGRGADCRQADFSEPESVQKLAAALRSDYDTLDAVVHNASAFTPTAEGLTEAGTQFETFFRVHMLAPFLLNEGLLELLKASDWSSASVVHITDLYSRRPHPDFHSYCATKAGLDSLTQSYAKRWAPAVRVNQIAPGPILFMDEHDEAHRQRILEETPLGIEGGLTPVIQAVDYLMDNDFSTGARIPVDGGRSLTY